MEIVTKKDFEQFTSKIESLLSGVGNLSSNTAWIMDLREVKKRTGYSEKQIQDHITAGRLNPWKDSDSSNSKLRFYALEVVELIPEDLRKKYGEPS